VFERFTESSRQVVVLAQDEARLLKHNYIGTEHLLLGLLREHECIAAGVLDSLGVSLEESRSQVARIIGEGHEITAGQIPFTPRAKKALELSLREAQSLGHSFIGTEHVLLGIARISDGVAVRVLAGFGVDEETIRNDVVGTISEPGTGAAPAHAELPPGRRRAGWMIVGTGGAPFAVNVATMVIAIGVGLLAGWLIWG
jgi:ATP-dependent Clp protease ATP-binding subunit ClpC